MSLQGLDNEQIHSITRIRYVVHECLRDQAGSVVMVASPPPENEDCSKRGRGKEKIRRKGMGKRRRKEELEQCLENSISRDDQLIPNYAATGIEYIEQIHHPVRLVNHQHLCHPDVTGVSEEMDDSRLCISVNEVVGDAQICLQENEIGSCDGVDGSQPPTFVDHQDRHCHPSDDDIKYDDHVNGLDLRFDNQEEPLSDEDIKLEEHGTRMIQGKDGCSSPHATLDECTPHSLEMADEVLPHSSDRSEESSQESR